MDVIRQLTDQINVFVRFFESVNCLFLQLRWLEENITRSSNSMLYLVFGIVFFCVIILLVGESGFLSITRGLGINDSVGHVLYELLPILIIVGVIALYMRRRFLARNNSSYGEVEVVDTDEENPLPHLPREAVSRRKAADNISMPIATLASPSNPVQAHRVETRY